MSISFKNRIILATGGLGVVTDNDIGNFLSEGVQDVITKTIAKQPDKAFWFSKAFAIGNATGVTLNAPIFDVTLNDVIAEEVSLRDATSVSDVKSIHYRTISNPCYFVKEGKIFIKPDPTGDLGTVISNIASHSEGIKITQSTSHNLTVGSYIILGSVTNGAGTIPELSSTFRVKQIVDDNEFIIDYLWNTEWGTIVGHGAWQGFSGKVTQVAYDVNVAPGDVSIDNMPEEREQLVHMYASLQVLKANMAVTATPSSIDLPALPMIPSFSEFTDIGDIGYTANQMITAEGTEGTSGADISTTLGSTTWDDMTNAITPPAYSGPVVFPDFSKAQTYLDDDDIELTASKLDIIRTEISEYQASIQNALNKFNKENTEYQSKVASRMQWFQAIANKSVTPKPFSAQLDGAASASAQTNIAEAQMKLQKETQEYASKLSKHQSEIASYQAEIGSLIQINTEELQRKSTKFQWLANEYAVLRKEYLEAI